jgi:hypothetical protein
MLRIKSFNRVPPGDASPKPANCREIQALVVTMLEHANPHLLRAGGAVG